MTTSPSPPTSPWPCWPSPSPSARLPPPRSRACCTRRPAGRDPAGRRRRRAGRSPAGRAAQTRRAGRPCSVLPPAPLAGLAAAGAASRGRTTRWPRRPRRAVPCWPRPGGRRAPWPAAASRALVWSRSPRAVPSRRGPPPRR
nr:uncharacterized protein C10orf95-like [Aegilops tauschii subsp. strangulata]